MRDREIKHGVLSVLGCGIISFSFLILLFMLICSTLVFVNGVAKEEKDLKDAEVEVSKTDATQNDSQPETQNIPTLVTRQDSVAYLINEMKVLEQQHETALADIRQETNNIINKVNGWIGFWIAILTIFGAIIPLVLQYILSIKSKKELEELMEKAKESTHNCQLKILVSSMEIEQKNSLLSDNSKRKALFDLILNKAYNCLRELVNFIFEKDDDFSDEDEAHLINALIQYSQIIEILSVITTNRISRKRLHNILDSIRTLIGAILDHENNTNHMVRRKLRDFLLKINNVSYE